MPCQSAPDPPSDRQATTMTSNLGRHWSRLDTAPTFNIRPPGCPRQFRPFLCSRTTADSLQTCHLVLADLRGMDHLTAKSGFLQVGSTYRVTHCLRLSRSPLNRQPSGPCSTAVLRHSVNVHCPIYRTFQQEQPLIRLFFESQDSL